MMQALLIVILMIVISCDGATENFSVSLASLPLTRLSLQPYGSLETYVAYRANSSYAYQDQSSSAWLLFIPFPFSSNASTSYILASYVFPSLSLLNQGAIVWMANRQNPVSRNASLTLNQTQGQLVLQDGNSSQPAWVSTFHPYMQPPVSMDLITAPSVDPPIGTLRVIDATNTTLWQSSDYPTDTLTVVQPLNNDMSLISWASASDPTEGLFSLVMEAGGIALYYNSSLPYWIWSYYGLNDSFGVTHTCRYLTQAWLSSEGGLNLSLSTSDLASSNVTDTIFCPAAGRNASEHWEEIFFDYGSESRGHYDITILQLQHDGNLVASTVWSWPWTTVYDLFEENRCLLPNYCGPYGVCMAPSSCECPTSSDGSFPQAFPSDRSQGCPPIHTVSCSSSTAELKLEELSGVDYFANKYSEPVPDVSTAELCKAACLQNCSCLAAFWYAHTSSCFHSSDMVGLQGSLNQSYMAFIKVEQHVSKSTSGSKSDRKLVIALALGAAALLVVMILATVVIRKMCRANLEKDEEDEDPFWNDVSGPPHRYSYNELESITKGFSEEMGKGGFGTVYAGALQDGTKVAVKCLDSVRQGKKEFRAEVVILGGVHHYNLVELIGFCAEGSHRLLVYEYMVNGSLDRWLYSTEGRALLDWKRRFNIALGAARGLAYLHGACRDTIVHLDVKPENILLNEEFEAKVSDFGLSTLIGKKETHVITTMRGTPGYLAPEWVGEGSQISAKCDVFSFGKVLMEILGSRRNREPSLDQREGSSLANKENIKKFYFPSWLYLHAMRQEKEVDLTDIAGVDTLEERRQAAVMLKTSFLCVLENPSQRPSMERVVLMLEGRVPELEDLDLAEISEGLQFALGMPLSTVAGKRTVEALPSLHQSLSIESIKPRYNMPSHLGHE